MIVYIKLRRVLKVLKTAQSIHSIYPQDDMSFSLSTFTRFLFFLWFGDRFDLKVVQSQLHGHFLVLLLQVKHVL